MIGVVVPLGSLGKSAKYLDTSAEQRSTAGSVPLHVAIGLQIVAAVPVVGIPAGSEPLLSAAY